MTKHLYMLYLNEILFCFLILKSYYFYSTWRWTPSRDDMFDYAHILDDRKVLVALGDIKQQAVGIFTQPFNKYAWGFTLFMIILFISISIALPILQKRYKRHNETFERASRLVVFLMWFCYTLVEIYYEGALTMFFSTESQNPFENIREVMRAYPDWKLLMQEGTDIYFMPYVESGDEDYKKFWKRVEETPEEAVYSGFEKTVIERFHDPVVLHVSQSAINVFKKNSQNEEADELEVFGEGSYDYFGLMTTKNSPLGVILQYASTIMSERGTFSYLKTKWLSNVEQSCGQSVSSDKTVVTMSHVSYAFIFYSILVLSCVMLLLFEIIFWKRPPIIKLHKHS